MPDTLPNTPEREQQILRLTRQILRILATGRITNEVGLAAMGCATQFLLDTIEPDGRMEAAEDWCAIILTTAQRSVDRDTDA